MKQVQTIQTAKQREVSFELLRILAMCMIVALHYLSKGQVLTALGDTNDMNTASVTAWVIEALCLPAVNLYVLISGYFGCKSGSRFRLSKLLRIWGTVVFYSVGITFVLEAAGQIVLGTNQTSVMQFSVYDWANVVLPVVTNEYWFITAYLVLHLLMPFLNAGMEKLDRKSFRNLLICLFVLFSVSKSVLPMELPMDQKGYDVLWFICMYLLGGYFRMYGCPFFARKTRSIMLYLGSVTATVGAVFVLRHLYLTRGMFAGLVMNNHFYTYNHIFCVAASVGLFGIFTKLSVKEGKVSEVISKTASCTLAVYLIHEQLHMRYLWPKWFHVQEQAGTWTFLPHMFVTVLCIFVVCVVVELIRKRVAVLLTRGITHWTMRE